MEVNKINIKNTVMDTKTTKNIGLKYKYSNTQNHTDECEVSRASSEIMLDRFCNGKEIEFPFS